jgi:hypothetical protein
LASAVLFHPYTYNKARAITKQESKVSQFEVSVSYKNYQKIFWINYKNKWRKLTDVFASLKEEGLIFDKNKIIQTLREDNLQKGETEPTSLTLKMLTWEEN